ncbi:NAD-dependent epimerase/dehydratase family protein [Aestuariivirga litoralis]|uniref:NAD-dependent epimerase/dehydratase family protein n=1 Tax=Aestuariivirga litoralis TaxID=2650924 RepID=UPI001AEEC7DA|nr:NAD(P)-dependent oxidoreductase [Aestuariivirga litoralis]
MRVALTGGTGFSGAFILPQLLAAGYDVTALARRPEALAGKCSKVIAGDFSRDDVLARLVAGADVVLHVGGATHAPSRQGFFDVNLAGTQRLYDAARKAGVTRFVYVSSLAAREPQLSAYGASKNAAEQFLLPLDSKECSVLILRPPAIYGPGDKATLPLFKLLQSPVAFMPGKKGSRFSLLYVTDFARIICDAVESKAHGLYELDDQAQGYDWQQLADANRALTGRPSRLVHLPHGVVHMAAGLAETAARFSGKTSTMNRQKIREIYHDDWVARSNIWPLSKPTRLTDGMAQTLDWYRAEGWLPQKNNKARSAA